MAGDVPKRPSYAIEDDTPSAKRKQLDNQMRVFVSDGVHSEGIGDFGMIQLDERSDRISNLPQELVHCILERLSVHDAARTSVLSKEWRCKWGMKNNLVLDKLFFLQLTANKDKDTHQSAFSRAVEMIILAHAGPLLSLNLFIPPKLDQFTVSRWLDHFLNKKVKVLEIFFSEKNACEIPLFTCEGLVEFKLTTGTLTASPKLGSFDNLRRVELIDVSITADISFGSQLKELLLYGCTGIHNLGCQFTNSNNLTYFILYKSEQIEWQWFKCTKQLKFLGLALTTVNPNTRMPVDLIKLLGDTPSISHLYVNGYTVEVLGQPFYPTLKGVAPRIEILRNLEQGVWTQQLDKEWKSLAGRTCYYTNYIL
ncbi:F-box/FBD/LRR-repeat protein At1g13570 isoform X2 [Daucus carota subsp. sativus]|uniref:F-box/FBD/LRR-repeat protein At1g13570 isoform X2 n=1 Tax=Daucus carota subsp. sativus TaxID=79200 RepID=UPI0007EF0606|nr:PREDICTED: F-box/FBD/LRR-repeat protein At1g13570-like isoform X2 [Daucus carota subsp. sativus]